MHVGAGVAGLELAQVVAGCLAQPVLVDHEGGRAELGGQVGERHAADRQPPSRVSAVRGGRQKRPTGAEYLRARPRLPIEDRRSSAAVVPAPNQGVRGAWPRFPARSTIPIERKQ